MESTLVSARVPRAKKEAAAGLLASLGATTSDLINRAFDYLLEKKELPCTTSERRNSQKELRTFVASTTFEVPWPDDFDGNYKTLVKQERLAQYESLA